MNKECLINTVVSLINVSENEAEEVIENFKFKAFDKNDFILKEGNISKSSFFVEKGICRSFVHDFEGVDSTVQFFLPGNFATDFNSLFTGAQSKENIQVLTPLESWYISFEDLQKDFHSKPNFREMGRAMLVRKSTQLKALMLEAKKLSAEERYLRLIEEKPEIIQYIPQRMIASFMGITESSLSRLRRKL